MANMAILIYAFLTSSLVLILAKLFDKKPPPIFGIYQRRSGVYWIKVLVMYVFLSVQKIKQKFPLRKKEYISKLDSVQKLAASPKAVDAVFFNGANKYGDSLILGTARRPNRLVDGFLFLKLESSGIGLLEFPKVPDTTLFNSGEEESYEAEGIKVIPLEPMKKWKIQFNGQLKDRVSQKLRNVSIDATYTSNEPWFNYDFDMDAWSMSKAIAYEKWSRSYFTNLRANHQLHYEQFGVVKAKIVVDEKEYSTELDSVRDHSLATHRDWASFRRYALHWVTTENGDHFSIGSICQPVTFSRLQIGYMYNARAQKVYPITDSDLELYQYGELGNPPKDYAFTFKAGNTHYEMQVNISEAPHFYISKQWESKVFECLCTVVVNGVKGYGGVEWEYRNIEGRNVSQDTDLSNCL